MKILVLYLLATVATAFVPKAYDRAAVKPLKMGYVPSGMSPEEYKRLKQKEQEEAKKKKFAAFGPQTFKSRSLQSFQKDLEGGKADHLMPVFNAKEKIKKGEIKKEDIPYMQRGGAWDNSDLGAAKRKAWRDEDKKYDPNAAPSRVDWMGIGQRSGPRGPAANAKPKPQTPEKPKKLFGLF